MEVSGGLDNYGCIIMGLSILVENPLPLSHKLSFHFHLQPANFRIDPHFFISALHVAGTKTFQNKCDLIIFL